MTTTFRVAMLAICLSLSVVVAGCPPFVEGVVPNEAGFEGAATVEKEEAQGDFGIVTVALPYRDIHGDAQVGLARLVLHRDALASGKPLPPLCHVHYEMSVDTAKKWAKRGWAVFTASYVKGDHPIDASVANGNNQARAILQWVRRLPFIDRTHLHINGGSQGGYMALAMSADFFPVSATTADCPVVNWAYNINFLEANKALTAYPDCEDSPMPVTCSVTMLSDWCKKYFGNDLSADAYYYGSPIAYLDRITNPVLLTCATGDMLVPMEQMSRSEFIPHEPQAFPAGFTRDFDTLTICERARVVFEDLIPEEARSIHRMPLQENSYPFSCDKAQRKKSTQKPALEDKPWSKEHQWSLLYLDEGPPLPCAGHTSHKWSLLPVSFSLHYQEALPSESILNAEKLDRLMQRYVGALENLPSLKGGAPINRLNFSAIEQRDVVQGLLDYAAMGDTHRDQLQGLYAAGAIRPWGDSLSLSRLEEALQSLKAN